ncbi:MAG: indole-3-glycerol phosphate synthase TrpC [Elainella sp.]
MQIRRRRPNPVVAIETVRYQTKVPDAEPRHILEEIVWHKEVEIERRREKTPLLELQKQLRDLPGSPLDFVAALRQASTCPALIAEVKKASPSKGVICENFDPVRIAESYVAGGAACLSVLTDEKFFQGSFEYLSQIRSAVSVPLLCKDFVIYPYQIYLARLHGADAVLLIAAILSDKDLRYFLKIAAAVGMAALVEVHTPEELDRVLSLPDVKLIGINNRNLETFTVDLNTTAQLLEARREAIQTREILVVSESGLHQAADLAAVQQAGAAAVLIGESLVKQPDPTAAIAQLFYPAAASG